MRAVMKSLEEVGAARSIVIDEDGVILAGNATVEAAGQLGIENVQIVETDGNTLVAVRRTGLTNRQKERLAILDNRAGELAEWDATVLAELLEDGLPLDDLFHSEELSKLLEDAVTDITGIKAMDGGEVGIPEQFMVMVTCTDEARQTELLEQLTAEGWTCRALMS
jgi:hypothetical protein